MGKKEVNREKIIGNQVNSTSLYLREIKEKIKGQDLN